MGTHTKNKKKIIIIIKIWVFLLVVIREKGFVRWFQICTNWVRKGGVFEIHQFWCQSSSAHSKLPHTHSSHFMLKGGQSWEQIKVKKISKRILSLSLSYELRSCLILQLRERERERERERKSHWNSGNQYIVNKLLATVL